MSQQICLRPINLFLVLLIFLAAACVSDPKTDKAATASIVNNTVSVGLVAEPAILNPILSPRSNERTVYRHIFYGLLTFDPQKDGRLMPLLAKAPPIIEDITEGPFTGGKRYTYEIREEAQWADGKPVLASDYIFTLKIVANPHVETAWRSLLNDIGDVEIDPTNPRKFTVLTKFCKIQQNETLGTAEIFPAHIYDPTNLMKDIPLADLMDSKKSASMKTNTDLKKFAEQFSSPKFSRNPAGVSGAGPYQLTSFKSKEQLVITKKKNWWGDRLSKTESLFQANPEKITYKMVPDVTTAIAMLKDGELDLMGEITSDLFVELKNGTIGQEKLNFASPDVPIMYFMALNTQRPTIGDKRVRQAIRHLIDLDQYIQDNLGGYGTRITSPYPKDKAFYHHDLPIPALDLEKAKQLLGEAGWTDANSDGVREKIVNGKKRNLDVEVKIRPQSVDGNKVVQIMQANAKKIGMNINIVHKESTSIRKQDVPAGNYDIIVGGIAFTASELVNSTPYFHTSQIPPKGRNYGRFGNAKTDALLEAIANNCNDTDARNQAYKEFQEILYDECPLIMLFALQERIAINKRFDNVVTSPLRPGYFENYFVAKK